LLAEGDQRVYGLLSTSASVDGGGYAICTDIAPLLDWQFVAQVKGPPLTLREAAVRFPGFVRIA
jgi:hypothetical protein